MGEIREDLLRPSPALPGTADRERAAFSDGTRTVTYGELAQISGRLSTALGVARGDRGAAAHRKPRRCSATRAVTDDRPFPELGFDSLTTLEVRARISTLAGRDIAAAALFDHPTVAELAAYLHDDVA
ncbi:MAG: hypothetical protein QOI78_2627 [Actinomycetota bacterium]|jgi:acyl carrier protein|nr:hypothetical protein [Actinomycetota bacterium]